MMGFESIKRLYSRDIDGIDRSPQEWGIGRLCMTGKSFQTEIGSLAPGASSAKPVTVNFLGSHTIPHSVDPFDFAGVDSFDRSEIG